MKKKPSFPRTDFILRYSDDAHSLQLKVDLFHRGVSHLTLALDHHWNLAEDALFVRCFENQSRETELYEDIQANYEIQHRMDPLRFPKTKVGLDLIQSHLTDLMREKLRYAMLVHQVESENQGSVQRAEDPLSKYRLSIPGARLVRQMTMGTTAISSTLASSSTSNLPSFASEVVQTNPQFSDGIIGPGHKIPVEDVGTILVPDRAGRTRFLRASVSMMEKYSGYLGAAIDRVLHQHQKILNRGRIPSVGTPRSSRRRRRRRVPASPRRPTGKKSPSVLGAGGMLASHARNPFVSQGSSPQLIRPSVAAPASSGSPAPERNMSTEEKRQDRIARLKTVPVTFDDLYSLHAASPFFVKSFRFSHVRNFLMFCALGPDTLLSRVEELAKKKLEASTARGVPSTHSIRRGLSDDAEFAELQRRIRFRFDTLREQVDSWAELEGGQFEKTLHDCMERDLREVREMYESQIHAIQSQLALAQGDCISKLDSLRERELSELQTLYDSYKERAVSRRANELRRLERSLEDLLPSDQVLSMLLIADLLHADELRRVCLDVIALNFSKFENSKDFGCGLFAANTFKLLLSKLDTATLVRLHNAEDDRFPKGALATELKYRKKTLKTRVKQMSSSSLLELQRRNVRNQQEDASIFVDIVQAEIRSRTNHIPVVGIDQETMHGFRLLNERKLLLECNVVNEHCSVRTSRPKDFREAGSWYLEVVVERFPASERDFGASIGVGWDVPRDSFQVPRVNRVIRTESTRRLSVEDQDFATIIGLTANKEKKIGCAVQSNGIFYHFGGTHYIGRHAKIKEGDVVGLGIHQFVARAVHASDQTYAKLSFFLNGQELRVGRSGTPAVHVKDPEYRLFPAATVFQIRGERDMRIQLRFNLVGPFQMDDIAKRYLPYSEYDARFNHEDES